MSPTPTEALREILRALDRKSNEEWLAGLDARKQAELAFHDMTRGGDIPSPMSAGAVDAVHANKKYYSTVGASNKYRESWIAEHARDHVFLDYACGDGTDAIRAAKAGAALAIGLDISRVSIELCRRRAEAAGVSANTFFIQGDCERTGMPDQCIDAAICAGMLHHLDCSHAFPELRRILKPGGAIMAMEALNYNPVIKLYRLLTPHLRTDWEKAHILSLRHLRFAQWFFEVRDVRYWHLCSILVTPFRSTRLFGPLLAAANSADRLLLRVMPISLLAWMFTFELAKPAAAADRTEASGARS